ncbi:ABC transporter permease [Halostreptopolyspora alba]|uniref:Transport permease protein n=2 Tax=Halostreptopolyspora alba TaxID=2487137 RepID=A0A3N0E8U6_9ACTN|nr:ABC transporter permease [Nocardiopsaceae bacterium YIM 96095]
MSTLLTFRIMLVREVRVIRREFVSFVLRTIMQPFFFVFVFAYVLPSMAAGEGGAMFVGAGDGPSYSTVLVPGLLASSMLFGGFMAVSMPLIMELSDNNEIEDRVLAPLPVWAVGLEKIVAGALQGLLAAVVVFPALYLVHAEGAAPAIDVANWPLLIVVLLSVSLLASALGLLLGTVIDARKISTIFGVIVVPVTMLGCVYYPWSALETIPWLQVLVLFNPMVYASEGLRATLTSGVGHMDTWAYLLFLVAGTGALTWLAVRSFTRRVRR